MGFIDIPRVDRIVNHNNGTMKETDLVKNFTNDNL